MPTCVMICLNDDGKVLVGEVQPDDEDMQGLQPVGSMDEAFKMAEQTLVGQPPVDTEQKAFDQTMAQGGDMQSMGGGGQ